MSWKTLHGPEWWLRLVSLFLVGGLLAACGVIASRTPPQPARETPPPPVRQQNTAANPVAPPPIVQPPPRIQQEELPPPATPGANFKDLIAWQAQLEKYFQGNPDGTTSEESITLKRHLSATTLDPDRERILLHTAGLFDRNRLLQLLQQQQPGSVLTPALQVALGDRYLAMGEAGTARSLWQQTTSARNAMLTVTEAQRRLQPLSTESPFRVGLLLPLSGRHAVLGEHLLHSAQQALADFPDVALELLVEDTAGVVEQALAGFERLATQGVRIVIGPVFLAPAKAVAEAARLKGIPLMPLNPHKDILQIGNTSQHKSTGEPVRNSPYPDVLLNAFLPEQQAEAIARYAMAEKGLRRFAILAPQTSYGEMTSQAFTQEVLRQGGEVVRVANFPDDSKDFTQSIKMLSQMETRGNFEGMFIPARADQVRLIAPQAANSNIGVSRVTYLGTAMWNNSDLLLSEGTDYLQGSFFCDTDPLLRQQFETRYQQIWGNRPPALAQLVYDSIAILAQAQRDQRLGGPNWRQILVRQEGFYSSSGRVRFLKNGLSQREYHFFQVTPQGIQSLTPPATPMPDLMVPDSGSMPTPGTEVSAPASVPGPGGPLSGPESMPQPGTSGSAFESRPVPAPRVPGFAPGSEPASDTPNPVPDSGPGSVPASPMPDPVPGIEPGSAPTSPVSDFEPGSVAPLDGSGSQFKPVSPHDLPDFEPGFVSPPQVPNPMPGSGPSPDATNAATKPIMLPAARPGTGQPSRPVTYPQQTHPGTYPAGPETARSPAVYPGRTGSGSASQQTYPVTPGAYPAVTPGTYPAVTPGAYPAVTPGAYPYPAGPGTTRPPAAYPGRTGSGSAPQQSYPAAPGAYPSGPETPRPPATYPRTGSGPSPQQTYPATPGAYPAAPGTYPTGLETPRPPATYPRTGSGPSPQQTYPATPGAYPAVPGGTSSAGPETIRPPSGGTYPGTRPGSLSQRTYPGSGGAIQPPAGIPSYPGAPYPGPGTSKAPQQPYFGPGSAAPPPPAPPYSDPE
ncbi:MAG: penicillin-binding protein activator [Magnetococcales bacterium]|nr:penicillin-binding protein activator [Magnetococcales bacterium]